MMETALRTLSVLVDNEPGVLSQISRLFSRKGFNIESLAELHRINQIASEMNKTARVSFRVNPDVDPKTHPYISTGLKENKFGIPYEEALPSYLTAAKMPNIAVTGIDCHIGSQLLDDSPLLEALDKLTDLFDRLGQHGIELRHIDIGGIFTGYMPFPSEKYSSPRSLANSP